jgi:hypothetical protein
MSIYSSFIGMARKSEDFRSIYKDGYRPARNWLSAQKKIAGDWLSKQNESAGKGVNALTLLANNPTSMAKSYGFAGGGGLAAGGILGGAYGFATGQEGGFTSGAMMGAAMGLGAVGIARHAPMRNSVLAAMKEPTVNHAGFQKFLHGAQEAAFTKPIQTAAGLATAGWLGTAVGTQPVNRLRRV